MIFSCSSCRFWCKDSEYKSVGECRRRAPVLQANNTRADLWHSAPRNVHLFPCTYDGHWCGEYEPKPEPKP